MRNWALVALLSLYASACTSDASGDTDTDTDGTSGTSTTDATSTPATSNPSTSSTATDTSSSGGVETTTDEGSSSSAGSSSDEGSGSSSTGPSTSAYQGSYAGTFEGACPNFNVSGTVTLEIDAEGTAVGAFMGNDSGPLEGTVDDAGALQTSGLGRIAGLCNYDGQIDDALAIDGTWDCPDFECGGTWTAGPVMK